MFNLSEREEGACPIIESQHSDAASYFYTLSQGNIPGDKLSTGKNVTLHWHSGCNPLGTSLADHDFLAPHIQYIGFSRCTIASGMGGLLWWYSTTRDFARCYLHQESFPGGHR